MVDFAAIARSVVGAFKPPPQDPLEAALAKRAMLGKPGVEVEFTDEEFDALQAYDEALLEAREEERKLSMTATDALDEARGKVRALLDGNAGPDMVNHPPHYTTHPSGVECITIAEHFTFNLGNAIKYIWRAGEKGSKIQDLEKARWYLDREIAKLKAEGRN